MTSNAPINPTFTRAQQRHISAATGHESNLILLNKPTNCHPVCQFHSRTPLTCARQEYNSVLFLFLFFATVIYSFSTVFFSFIHRQLARLVEPATQRAALRSSDVVQKFCLLFRWGQPLPPPCEGGSRGHITFSLIGHISPGEVPFICVSVFVWPQKALHRKGPRTKDFCDDDAVEGFYAI